MITLCIVLWFLIGWISAIIYARMMGGVFMSDIIHIAQCGFLGPIGTIIMIFMVIQSRIEQDGDKRIW